MMKELISYNDSLMLRELGFDEACFAWYSKGQLILEHHIIFTGDQYYMRKEDCNAPTFSQAFRFFREKHSLHSNIKCVNTTSNNHFRFEIELNGETLACTNRIDSYEKAELACLQKMIELVKNKSV